MRVGAAVTVLAAIGVAIGLSASGSGDVPPTTTSAAGAAKTSSAVATGSGASTSSGPATSSGPPPSVEDIVLPDTVPELISDTRDRIDKGVPALDALDAASTVEGLDDDCGRALPTFDEAVSESTEIADPVLSEMWTAQAADTSDWRRSCQEGKPDDDLRKRILTRQVLIEQRKEVL